MMHAFSLPRPAPCLGLDSGELCGRAPAAGVHSSCERPASSAASILARVHASLERTQVALVQVLEELTKVQRVTVLVTAAAVLVAREASVIWCKRMAPSPATERICRSCAADTSL